MIEPLPFHQYEYSLLTQHQKTKTTIILAREVENELNSICYETRQLCASQIGIQRSETPNRPKGRGFCYKSTSESLPKHSCLPCCSTYFLTVS